MAPVYLLYRNISSMNTFSPFIVPESLFSTSKCNSIFRYPSQKVSLVIAPTRLRAGHRLFRYTFLILEKVAHTNPSSKEALPSLPPSGCGTEDIAYLSSLKRRKMCCERLYKSLLLRWRSRRIYALLEKDTD